MEHLLSSVSTPNFEHFIAMYGVLGIFIWFVTFDQIAPLPEEITLLTIGYLASNQVFNPIFAAIVSLGSMLLVDVLYYLLSRKGSMLLRRKSSRSESPFVRRYKEKLSQDMPKTLVALTFIPRMRIWGPILVGATHAPFKKFFFYDALALTCFTAIYFSLGYFFHASLLSLLAKFGPVLHNWIFFIVLVVVAYILLYINNRLNRVEKAAA